MQRVSLHIDEQGIAIVTLNRPDKMNALDMPMFKALNQVIKQLKSTKHLRAVIVHGAGDDFCSGLDVKSVIKKPAHALSLLFKWLPWQANLAQKVSHHWRRLPVPVIAAIQGRCWGGGTQIALGADFRIASYDASLSIMEAKWGLIPDMAGNRPLAELMPLDQAKKLAMTAQVLSAEQAKEYGLVTELADNALERAKLLAEQLLATSPDVLKQIKLLYSAGWKKSAGWWLANESWAQIKILAGKNQRIAVKRAQGKDIDYI